MPTYFKNNRNIVARAGMARRQKGATLIEALISLLIFSLGLLGIAGLIVTSIAQQQTAHKRAEGAVYAADIAERMRANVAGLNTGGYVSTNGTRLIATHADAKTASDAIRALDTNTCRTMGAPNCTPQQIAAVEFNNWLFTISQNLPSGVGLIQGGAEPTTRMITIVWDAKATSSTDQAFVRSDPINCPATLRLTPLQRATFRCVTVPFMP